MKRTLHLSAALALLAALPALADPATGWLQTAAGTYDYNDAANWVDGDINGVFGADLTLAGAQTITFSQDTTLPDGLTFAYAGAYAITLKSDGSGSKTLTLGGDITASMATDNAAATVTIGGTGDEALVLDLDGANRTIAANQSSKAILSIPATIANGALTIDGPRNLKLSGANTYAGGTTIAGATYLYINSETALGTGDVSINNALNLCADANMTMTANNTFFMNADRFFYRSGKALDIGTGDFVATNSFQFWAEGDALTIHGRIVDADGNPAPWKLEKWGSKKLYTYSDANMSGGETFIIGNGEWYFNGSIAGAGFSIGVGTATSGTQHFRLQSANTFQGTLSLLGGSLYVYAGDPNALPVGSTVAIAAGTYFIGNGQANYISNLLANNGVTTDSAGTLCFNSSDNGNIDLTDYPNLILGSKGGTRTLSGTVTWPDVNPLRLGGGGDPLTFSGANAVPSGRDIEFFGKIQFNSENDTHGTLTVRNGGLLILDGADGALPNAAVVVEQGGELRFTSSVECDVLRANDVTLKAGTLNFNGNKSKPVKHHITRLTLTTMPAVGGTPQMTWSSKESKQTTLYIDEILRPDLAMLNVGGGSPGLTAFESGWNIVVSSGVENTSEGTIGTTTAPFVPWMRNGSTTLVYNDPDKGLRFHTSEERQTYSANYEAGGPVVSGENMLINVSGTVKFTDSMATVATFCFGAKENQYFKMNEGGVLKVTSGTFGCTYNKVYPQVSIDLNGKHGYVLGVSNRAPQLQGSIGGTTQGLTIANESGERGNYIEVHAAGTYSGDVYIHGAIWNQSATFLPAGIARPGNVYVEGWWRCGNASPTINGLYGSGLVEMNNNYNQTITMGSDGSNGDYNGRIERSKGTLALTKIGAGRQRLGGECNYNGATRIEGGTLQIDGANSNSAFTVLDGAALAGCGSITKAVTLQSGAALSLGSAELPEDRQMDFGTSLAFASGSTLATTFDVRSDRACGAIVAGNVIGDGVEVPVSVLGEGPGRWLLLEAASIQPDFVLAQGVSGRLETVATESTTQIWYERADEAIVILFR